MTDPTDHATRLADSLTQQVDHLLADADAALTGAYPGGTAARQPVHTVYVPGHLFRADLVGAWGADAAAAIDERAGLFAEVAGGPDLVSLVRAKLAAEPIEDLRVDFEDGYGRRSDEEEDAAALATARVLASAVRAGAAPPYAGIRFKSLEAPTRRRGLRTLDLFVGALAGAGGLGEGLVLTLPKVTSVEQVAAMVHACGVLEQAHDLPAGALRFEVQVETPQAILGADGTVLVARMIHAAAGRCTGLHYGTYDYSASCGISAEYQSMEHPAADHAKAVMQVAAAGTGVFVCDGSTNVVPAGGHDAVHRAWRLHQRLVRRSLERGLYQGWDMHPGQLPTRFLATFAFYREGLPAAAGRLRAYLGGDDAGYLDEPATARALASYVLRGLDCGAVDQAEADRLTGVDEDALLELAQRGRR